MRFLLAVLTSIILTGVAMAQDFAMDAPDKVGMREMFPVTWTAPQPKGGLIEIRHTGEKGRRVSYAYANKNPQLIEAPEAPGDYVLVFHFDGQDQVSQPLAVEMVTATLSAPAEVEAGGSIVVTWTGPTNRNDNITFAVSGGEALRKLSYAYVGSSKDGTVTLQAPQDAATYDIVYISGKTILARHSITVGGIAATLDAPDQVPAGGSVMVGFEGPLNRADLITFAARDGNPIRPASYAYAVQAQDGQVSLRAFEETGSYDIVYVSGDRVIGRRAIEIVPISVDIAAADEVQALLTFEVEWRGHGNPGDRVYMVRPGDTVEVAYNYVDPTIGTVAIVAPEAAGAYELVYVTAGGRELDRRAITVTPAALDPGQIQVEFTPGTGFGPNDAVEVILDASGSMLQRQGGERRIAIAKRTLSGLVRDTIPQGTGFALRVFGNRQADACRTDLEIPLAPLDASAALTVISGINAVNLAKTPIAQSVSLAAGDLAGVTGARVLILVTDGEETCEGDPAQAIEALRALGWDLRVNIVGYAIDDAVLARTFESWAAAGGGAYFDAADGDQLAAAMLRAAAAPFRIVTPDGDLVATGLVGDPPVTVPAGSYLVRIAGTEVPVTVEPRRLSRVAP